MSWRIDRLVSGGLITNYYCSSTCRHCLYRCSPAWPKKFMSAEVARANLAAVRRLGCRAVHIGGGEPLLRPDGVAGVLEVAAEVGVHVEYVETNSSWYRDHASACATLEMLAARGLSTLLVSISPLHNEHIPFHKVRGVIAACRTVGVSTFPWVDEFVPDLAAFDERRPHALAEYEEHFGAGYLAGLPQRYWISPGGRALETFAATLPPRTTDELAAMSSGGCRELADVSHFHLDLYGNYVPGLCAGLAIRRADLGAPLAPDDYPLLTRLYAGGVGALLDYAADTLGFRPSVATYGSKCELCYAVRRWLVVEQGSTSHELQPRGHYLYG